MPKAVPAGSRETDEKSESDPASLIQPESEPDQVPPTSHHVFIGASCCSHSSLLDKWPPRKERKPLRIFALVSSLPHSPLSNLTYIEAYSSAGNINLEATITAREKTQSQPIAADPTKVQGLW